MLAMKIATRLLLLILTLTLCACASNRRYGSSGNGDENDWDDLRRSGATPTTHDALETINLIELLDPLGKVKAAHLRNKSDPTWEHLSFSTRYDLIFAQFATLDDGMSSTRLRRNLVQNRMMAASDRRCGRFFQFMKKDSSDTNFKFAIGASVLSTAGALVPGLRAAQNLSGLSALTSGLRAEYNNEYYANLATSVITRGIEEKRNEMRHKMRIIQSSEYLNYDIASAVADAVQYDASCNIVYGLEQANEAMQRLNEPGRDAINRALYKDKLARALASGDTNALKNFKDIANDVGIPIDSMLSGLVAAGVNSGAPKTLSDDYPLDVSASAVTAKTAESLAYVSRQLSELQIQLSTTLTASSSTLGSITTTQLQGSISASLSTLSQSLTASIAGEATGTCITKANDLAGALSKAISAWQIAKAQNTTEADKNAIRDAQDGVRDAKQAIKPFWDKLDRYEKAAREFKDQRFSALEKTLKETKPDLDAYWKIEKSQFTFDMFKTQVGAANLCSK
jgi:hypothetical protein